MDKMKEMLVIMKDISQIFGDLVKVQLHQITEMYKQILTKILTWALIIQAALLLAIGALAMIIAAIYMQLAYLINPIASAYILGAFLFLLAAVIYLLANAHLKK